MVVVVAVAVVAAVVVAVAAVAGKATAAAPAGKQNQCRVLTHLQGLQLLAALLLLLLLPPFRGQQTVSDKQHGAAGIPQAAVLLAVPVIGHSSGSSMYGCHKRLLLPLPCSPCCGEHC